MKFIIVTKPIGGLNIDQSYIGPFEDYDAAMAHFVTMGPASSYEHKYIVELFTPEEIRRISGDEDLEDVGGAFLEDVPAEWREELIAELLDEVSDMSSRELVFLMIEGMDAAELKGRWEEIARDSVDGPVTHH